jgi:hypothetical protein
MTKDELEKANIIQRDLVKLDSMKKHERFCVNGNHFESPIINEKIRSTLAECAGILSREFKGM